MELQRNLGYAYVKFLDIDEYIYGKPFQIIYAYVFDYFSQTSCNRKIPATLENCEYLVNPMSFAREINKSKKGEYTIIGTLPINENDLLNFDSKTAWMNEDTTELWDKLESWNYDKVEDRNRSYPSKYKTLKHLPDRRIIAMEFLQIKTTMLYLRRIGKNILDYYSFGDDSDEQFLNWRIYNIVINEVFYKDIPNEIRGKALVKGNVEDKWLNYWETH